VRQHWWLSFCDTDKPAGTQFLGACIVGPASDIGEAAQLAWWLGINPGGEVAAQPIPQTLLGTTPFDYLGRLLTRAECDAVDKLWGKGEVRT
jgi:hypothetical protein